MNHAPDPIEATWWISLDCECPSCKKDVNLLNHADFWDGRSLNLCEHNTDRSKALEVVCPECGHEFVVKTTY